MKILKCENGHFFDVDKYEVCPICGAAAAGKKDPNENDKRRVVFNRAPKSEERVVSRRERPADEDARTVALLRGADPDSREREIPSPEYAREPQPAPQPAPVPEAPAAPQPVPAAPAVGLAQAMQQSSSISEGKTLSYFSSAMKTQKDEAPKAAEAAAPAPAQAAPAPAPMPAPGFAPGAPAPDSTPEDPVAGWLVCIGGPHLCEALPIHVGLNSIGRNSSNRMVIGRDPGVSREKHAFITFEPRAREFFLRPGDSSGLTYLNGKYIYETKALTSGDIIELGKSRFYFFPLCGEKFSWEDYLD